MAAQRLNQAIDGAPPRKVFCNRRCERASDLLRLDIGHDRLFGRPAT